MRAIIEGIPNTIRTRKGGTVYFVPAAEKQTLLAFKHLIESLPVDPGSASTPYIIMVPIVDEAHAREELARAVHIGFVADLEEQGVRMGAVGPRSVRAVTHLDVDAEAVQRALEAVELILSAR